MEGRAVSECSELIATMRIHMMNMDELQAQFSGAIAANRRCVRGLPKWMQGLVPRVTTMTISVMLSSKDLENHISSVLDRADDLIESGVRVNVNRCFSRQVTFVIPRKQGSGRLNVKVFIGGRLHITGCREPSDLDTVMRIVKPDDVHVVSVKICMINATLKASHGLHLIRLRDVLRTSPAVRSCTFDPDVYSGVNATADGWSLIAFSSGSMMFVGCRSFDAFIDGFSRLARLLVDHRSEVFLCASNEIDDADA
jgi:TATA-box binding protein (TBP) (component of TFIID and TFIIIB)